VIDILGFVRAPVARLLGDLIPDVAHSNGGKPPLELSRRLPPEPAAVPEARAALEPVGAAVEPEAFDNLRLLVTELVTNSVRHGAQEGPLAIELSVVATPHRVRAEVVDSGPGFVPPARSEGDDQGSGWGLHLVGRLSDRWGVERNGRTVVWFELAAAFEREWWLAPTSEDDVRSEDLPADASWRPDGIVRRLPFVWSSLAQRRQPEADVD
jgi:anti-sigma regulatory factor (Ser/Thr protein kinase)